jgi:hypothetical protein
MHVPALHHLRAFGLELASIHWSPGAGATVSIGWMIQESNRSHAAESRCIKHQEKVGFKFQHYIMRKLVLGDYGKEISRGLVPEGPLHDLLEIAKRASLIENLRWHAETSCPSKMHETGLRLTLLVKCK